MRVQHRHIIYVQGYDPRGLAQYYRMFRTELRKFGRLYQLTATISRPKVASDGEIASWTIETKAGDWQTRTSLRFPALRGPDPARPCRADLAHGFPRRLDLLAPGLQRHHRAVLARRTGGSRPSSPTRISCCCSKPLGSLGVAFVFEKGLDALGIPDLFSIAAAVAMFVALLGSVLKYTENAHLPAVSPVRHDLDLGILAPRAAGMGPAHRPLRATPRQRRARPATPRKSSSSATVPDRSWAPRSWRAR